MAGRDDDKDRTVFGLPLPPRDASGDAPRAVPRPDARSVARSVGGGDGDRTVIGGALPGGWSGNPSGGRPADDDTWLGGALPGPDGGRDRGGRDPPAPHDGRNPGAGWAQGGQPQASPPQRAYGQPAPFGGAGPGNGLFPDLPRPQAAPDRVAPRISLEAALRPSGLAQSTGRNPILRAASDLLILLGRLRTGLVEMRSQPLLEHTAQEIDRFGRRAMEAGAAPQDVELGKYALSATADDIVQNLPGNDRGAWIQYGMAARFFNDRASGVNLYRRLEGAMRAPRGSATTCSS